MEAVARHRHFTRAAEELHVAQSALSAQVRRLEAELGTQLLRRTTRSVELTEAGEHAVRHARAALAAADALRGDIDELRGLERGTVAIGALIAAGEIDVPALLQRFHRLHPGIEIEFREGTAQEMFEHLARGELDAAFTLEAGDPPQGLGRREVSREELVAAMARRHPLAGADALPIQELQDVPLIAFRRGSAARHAMDAALEQAATAPRIRLEGSDLGLIRALAARGFGVAILPRSFAELPGQPLSIRALEPRIELPVTLLWRDSPSPAAKAFIAFVAG
ncbi:MAG: LysR family transcriptional regulator [Actinomycetota bacterium]|nr:LysR family transcriptional regulator [Actinomycetota bacterium]